MSSFNKKNFADRVNNLAGTTAQTDEELANRFQTIFSSKPIASQNNYHIPADAYNDDIDREIEKMLQESDQEEDDALDNYIYGVLSDTAAQQKMDDFQTLFLGSNQPTEEADDLIRKLQHENALDQKYQQFTKSRDDDMQKRFDTLRSEPVLFTASTTSGTDKPRGSVPKPLQQEELHDEMDDWCCICNDDATVECEGCEDDNKYCNECFFHTHQSESAEYEATKHKSKRYQK